MNAATVLERARAAGLRIRIEGDRLKVAPASALTPELRAVIVAHKPELLHMLANQVPAIAAPSLSPLPADLAGYCPTHQRWLGFPEQDTGHCSWCAAGLPQVAPTSPPLRSLTCLGCGAPMPVDRAYRCVDCVEAAARAVLALVAALVEPS